MRGTLESWFEKIWLVSAKTNLIPEPWRKRQCPGRRYCRLRNQSHPASSAKLPDGNCLKILPEQNLIFYLSGCRFSGIIPSIRQKLKICPSLKYFLSDSCISEPSRKRRKPWKSQWERSGINIRRCLPHGHCINQPVIPQSRLSGSKRQTTEDSE